MSTPVYSISPDLMRELSSLASAMEDNILQAEVYEAAEVQRQFYAYKGFNHAMSYITALVHNYTEQAEGIRDEIKSFHYEGKVTYLEEDEEEEGDD